MARKIFMATPATHQSFHYWPTTKTSEDNMIHNIHGDWFSTNFVFLNEIYRAGKCGTHVFQLVECLPRTLLVLLANFSLLRTSFNF